MVVLNPNSNGNGRPDALAVLDVDPNSSTYNHVVGRVRWAWATRCTTSAGTPAARRSVLRPPPPRRAPLPARPGLNPRAST